MSRKHSKRDEQRVLAEHERQQRLNRLGFMCHLSARGPQLVDPGIHGAVIADEMLQRALNVNLQSGDKIWTPPVSVSAA
jgi:hypothetical protein